MAKALDGFEDFNRRVVATPKDVPRGVGGLKAGRPRPEHLTRNRKERRFDLRAADPVLLLECGDRRGAEPLTRRVSESAATRNPRTVVWQLHAKLNGGS
ncbi:hypothetical protein EBO15_08160 [Actinomadura harenae]|uniref:Uncharacterized protein n=1 Tax=Actinomadura harenae TaxID=2483351 RepID=A0A3M2M989_9ACTN|nr:hypothetical protein EBO15_08160 [Actinomadura harenae]